LIVISSLRGTELTGVRWAGGFWSADSRLQRFARADFQVPGPVRRFENDIPGIGEQTDGLRDRVLCTKDVLPIHAHVLRVLIEI
jgi:hypothetical protein